ncbi:MAG: hypothetical protein IJS29_00125, partial [Selenomonadaceae bacterium]|nr:hypothetical protein [Selenomonadaceae bacterium]
MSEKNNIIAILNGDDTINKKSTNSEQSYLQDETSYQYAVGSYPIDVIKKFIASLDTTSLQGEAALDEAVKACSDFDTVQDAIDQMIADLKSTDSDTFLTEKCGIILNNSDTGAITGSDAGGSTTKTSESIVPESGTATYPTGTSFTKRGLTVTVPEKSTLTTDQQTIVQGLYSWWVDECLDLIEESYGLTFDDDATVKTINLDFDYDLGSGTLAAVGYNYNTTNGKTQTMSLYINTKNFFKNLSTTNVNGSTANSTLYLDRTLAHELTHAIMAAKVDYHSSLPLFFKEGIAELTHGIDDFRISKIKELVKNPTKLKNSVDVSLLKDGSTDNYAGGYIFLRYLAQQGAEVLTDSSVDKESISVSNGATLSGSDDYTLTGSGTYTIAAGYTGTITINTPYAVTLDGANAGNLTEVFIKVASTTTSANVTINDLRIANTSDSVIDYGGTLGSNQLNITGTLNSLSNTNDKATVNIGSGLIVNGTGTLNVSASGKGAAIGTDYGESDNTGTLTIGGGTITATATDGAALGSGAEGSIDTLTIAGGTITVSATNSGAAIGSGLSGSVSSIAINGQANVTASSYQGAAVGSGVSASAGTITINSQADVTATAGRYASAIGAGYAPDGTSS